MHRIITALTLIFYICSSLSVAAEPAVCIDQEEMHILAQEQFSLADCHLSGAVQARSDLQPDIILTAEGTHETSCYDIYFNSFDSSIVSHQTRKLLSGKMVELFIACSSFFLTAKSSWFDFAVYFKTYQFLLRLVSLQTVVLLI
ncbi:MAG: hypothetical protein KKB30_10430 [Proteobacteria bacterium]|nr:hypothetical protein [Pseudomonadota bacterium]MBU1717053.1 hypothetical protein [Pseudomonadota bacterium]